MAMMFLSDVIKMFKIRLLQWLHNSVNILTIIESHTSNWWILWYIN